MNKIQSESAHKWIQKGRGVWVKADSLYPNPNQDAFLEGKAIDVGANDAIIQLIEAQRQFKIPLKLCQKLTYGPTDVSDMVDLQQLNQPQLLYNIKRRYFSDLIFTYCGPTLLIINPYEFIQKLFNDTVLQQYQTLVFTQNLQYKNLVPHIFGLAAFCLWQLFDNQRNQSIVISGQSGAGKTQNTKYCLKFLASLGRNIKQILVDKSKKVNYQNIRIAQKAVKKTSSKLHGIQDRILGCNQILEAFGNSKTIRNDNSSRFGKLILLLYGDTQIDIKSAFITSYLLEKSRIVSVSDGQRNYHIFYYFIKGTTNDEKKKYQLNDPINKYYYLNQSITYDVKGSSDQSKFIALKQQFQQYLSQQQIQCVFKIISTVLNIGNLLFKKGQNANHQQTAIIINQEYLKIVAKLLQIDFQKFKHSLQYKTRKLGTNVIDSPLKYDQALALRDSFSKNIYQRTFNFLVEKLNDKIQIQKIDLEAQSKTSRAHRKSIGLLDIFGFQVLGINTLQQFFINFANEKLQQLYVSYIFKQQQNQFLRQGLKQFSHDIGFQDNKPIIDLFELYPLGIFHLINQSSQLNKADQQLPSTISRNHPKNPFIVIPISKKGFFQISHSCSPVTYNTNSFTAKNKDQFPKQLLQVIEATTDPIVKSIIVTVRQSTSTTGRASKKYLGSKFLNEMNKLTQQLYSCDCHFVRCIKPNSKKSPKLFNSQAVLQSLRYLGVLDSIIIRKLGYIYRRPFKQFYKKFYQIEQYAYNNQNYIRNMNQQQSKQQSRKIVMKFVPKQLSQKNILFGVKKILIKQSALNCLELIAKQKRRLRIQSANKIKQMYTNSVFRGKVKIFIFRVKILKTSLLAVTNIIRKQILHKKTVQIQNVIKKYLWQKRLERIKQQATKSVTKISAYIKMKKQRKIYLQIRKKTIRLQSCCRAFLSAGKFLRYKFCRNVVLKLYQQFWNSLENKKAVTIQKFWKGYSTRKKYRSQIAKIKKHLALSKIRQKFKRALFRWKYLRFQQALNRYRQPIIKLQAIVRGRYCQRVYKKLVKSTIIIQKAYRKHLTKKFYLNRLWQKYKLHLSLCQQNKQRQLNKFGIRRIQTKIKTLQQTVSIPYKLYPNQLLNKYVKNYQNSIPDWKINESVSLQKNTIQCYIADLDLISDSYYQGNWSNKYLNIKNQMNNKNQYPLSIKICDGFTTILSNRQKLYTFQSQIEIKEDMDKYWTKIDLDNKNISSKIQTSQNSGYLITTDNKLYVWGDNKNSQLLLNNNKTISIFIQNKYVKNISDIATKGENLIYLNTQGKCFKSSWSYKDKQRILAPIQFSDRVSILAISGSYSFIHFLTNTGLVYSQGSNNAGQLGLGAITSRPINQPQLNNFLKSKKQIIESISTGISHTIAKSKLGYVYGWGDNSFGQINSDKIQVRETPILVELTVKNKILQAVAGLRNTFYLLDNLKIVGYGVSSSFPTQKSAECLPIQFLNETLPNSKNLFPVRIQTTWIRTMSLLTVNCIDLTKCKQGTKPDVINKYCKNIAKEWINQQIYPQYHQWMDNILHLSDMRKFKFLNQNNKKITNTNKSYQPENQLEQLKLLMELRKTSSLFRQAAKKKMQQLQRKLQYKNINQWNQFDQEINKYIKQHCVNILN